MTAPVTSSLAAEQDARIRDIEDVYRTIGELRTRVAELEARQAAAAKALTQTVAPIYATLGRIAEAITGDES